MALTALLLQGAFRHALSEGKWMASPFLWLLDHPRLSFAFFCCFCWNECSHDCFDVLGYVESQSEIERRCFGFWSNTQQENELSFLPPFIHFHLQMDARSELRTTQHQQLFSAKQLLHAGLDRVLPSFFSTV